jgi:hypothetical protein
MFISFYQLKTRYKQSSSVLRLSAWVLSFGSLNITNFNIMDYSKHFIGWKQVVKGRVIIHSNVVFSDANGIELKKKLEELTGLPFEIRLTNENN